LLLLLLTEIISGIAASSANQNFCWMSQNTLSFNNPCCSKHNCATSIQLLKNAILTSKSAEIELIIDNKKSALLFAVTSIF